MVNPYTTDDLVNSEVVTGLRLSAEGSEEGFHTTKEDKEELPKTRRGYNMVVISKKTTYQTTHYQ